MLLVFNTVLSMYEINDIYIMCPQIQHHGILRNISCNNKYNNYKIPWINDSL